MREHLVSCLACAFLTSVACGGSDHADRSVDGSTEGGDGAGGRGSGGRSATGGRSSGNGGARPTGNGGRTTGAGGFVGAGGRGSGGVAEAGVEAGEPDAGDADLDAAAPDATRFDAPLTDAVGADTTTPDATLDPSVIDLVFDEASGVTTYIGLNAGNWLGDPGYVTPHSGAEAILSANGNATGTFNGLGVMKILGGVIENRPYTVSFYVVQYYPGLSGIELSDFSVLRIGGPSGTVTWNSTPVPTVTDQWVQWTGTYVPAPSDVGQPFRFEAVFDLDAMHSIGIDGPIRAVP